MKLNEMIIKGFEKETLSFSRSDKREFNKCLDNSKWMIAFPIPENGVNTDWIHGRIVFVFSDHEPEFVPRGVDHGECLEKFANDCDMVYECQWKEIAIHMEGSIWISTDSIKRLYIEPVPFSELDKLPCLGYEENVNIHQAVTDYLGCGEDYNVDELLENYLKSLPLHVLRLEIVFDDVEQRNWYEYGERTVVIYYNNELVGYASFAGRELIYRKFFTTDIKKFQNCMKDIVDKSGVHDIMIHSGVTVVSTEDADLYVGVPGYTKMRYK